MDVTPVELIAATRASLARDVQPVLAAGKREGGTLRACLAALAYAEVLLTRQDAVLAEDSADMRDVLALLGVEAPVAEAGLQADNRALRQAVATLSRTDGLPAVTRETLRALALRQSDRDYSLLQPVEALPPI